MTVDVDEARISERVAQRRQQGCEGVDLWVELDGLERPAGMVRAAVDQIDDEPDTWDVQPTTGGAWTWLRDVGDWNERVRELAAVLSGMGHAGSIAVPWVDPWFHGLSDVPFPTAYLAHRVDPPGVAGPFNAHGVPEPRWGLPEPTSERLLTQAAAWALVPGTGAHVGAVVRTPVQEHDAFSLIRPLLDRRISNLTLASTSRTGGELRRSVRFDAFGQTWWIDLDRDADPVALCESARRLLVEHASDLLYGAVALTFPGTDELVAATPSVWRRHPQHWAEYVPDAFGVQLVTGRHLTHARDLSQWHVTEIAVDRWLVAARDLTAWFRAEDPSAVRKRQFPDPDLRARARDDFGAMILTREFAESKRGDR